MTPRLPTDRLEVAITGCHTLESVCGEPFALLEEFRIADYVGSYRMRSGRYDEHDLMAATAQVFFEEDGVLLARLDGAEYGKEYSVLLFGTFLVVEFNAFTADAHFLVLAPALDYAEGARYHGLWAAQRIEHLQGELRCANAGQVLFAELDCLLWNLRTRPRPQIQRHWYGRLRLFGHRQGRSS